MDNKLYIGSVYYPEHWPRERWPHDIQLMKEAGVNVLRLGELAWSKLEPTDGQFDFSMYDDFIELVAEIGVKIVLGTPIEGSPVWLRHKFPDVVAKNKFRILHAERGHHCHNNKDFAFHVSRITTKMAEHYANHPAVIGWQLDNEMRAVPCYCNVCEDGFRDWLQDRYGTLDQLNESWGTVFWSQVYNTWDEVKLPAADQLTITVSQQLDFNRFQSDSTVHHMNRMVDIVKKHGPHQFTTHNSLGLYLMLDLNKLGEKLDYMGVDFYPHVDSDNIDTVLSQDLHRGTKRKNFWVMEQKNGYFNYSDYNLAIEPGLVRLWALQDIARGANAVLFYRWRSGRYSWEQNPNGILRHDGTPRRAYYEIQQLTGELEAISSQLAETEVEAPVAILHSYEIAWAFEAHKQYTNFSYRGHIISYYKALLRMGVTVDLVDPSVDLSRYKFVIAPSLLMVNDDIHQNLMRYVENGGQLIIGARSGMKNWENVTIDTPWPGLLSEMAGIEIDEFEVLPDKYTNTVSYEGKEYSVKVWLDMLRLTTAESMAVYKEKFYAGRTAISRNKYGKGVVYYVGVMGSEELFRDLITHVADETGLSYTSLPDGIFVSSRVKDNDRYTFYVNINKEPTMVKLLENGNHAVSGNSLSGEVLIKGLDVLIVHS